MVDISIKELSVDFDGRGEVSGYSFKLVEKTENGYLYEVSVDGRVHYEVFKRTLRQEIINSETMELSKTDFVVSYPRSTSFGVWAWTCNSLERAKERLSKITEEYNGKERYI